MPLVDPPKGVAPERLFRLLLPLRPVAPLAYRISCAPDVPLSVRAIAPAEEQAAYDSADDAPAEIRRSRVELEMLARCLWTPSGRAFDDARGVGQLPATDVAALAAEAWAALSRICPSYRRSNAATWRIALELGASHWTNLSTVLAMGSCAALHVGARGTTRQPRPDRYWGAPVVELLDGHWMAMRAALAALDSKGRE